MRTKEEKARLRKINKFNRELDMLIDDLPEEELQIAKHYTKELSFMAITLEELKNEVNKKGAVTEMSQGKYSIERENPALKSYNIVVKQYNTMLSKLYEIVSKTVSLDEGRDLLKFAAKKQ